MTLMLASVLSRAEAEIATARGADVIDCKDTARGALGALSLARVSEIVVAVGGRRPVSAVVELPHDPLRARSAVESAAAAGVQYVKFALPVTPDADAIIDALSPLCSGVSLIAVLFADLGPDFERLPKLAQAGFTGVMLDTAHKGKGRLIDHMGIGSLSAFVARCRELGLQAGLAGSLEPPDVPRLLVMAPDVLGFRGALCSQHDRRSAIEADAVTLIRDLIPRARKVEESELASAADRPRDGAAANVDWSLVGRGYAVDRQSAADVDHVFVRDLVIPIEIGAYAHERGRVQRVRFNVETEVYRSSGGDDMRSIFSYDVVIDAIKMILSPGHIELVETIAERLAESVLLHERVRAVSVQIEKLDVAPGAVGVRIRRERPAETAKIHLLFPGLADAADAKPKS
jgi:dihydroneopterin aldolase